MWDFPRLQLAVLCVVTGSAIFFWRPAVKGNRLLAFCLFGAALYQLGLVAPYTPLYPTEVQSTERLDSQRNIRLYTANVLMSNPDHTALLEQVQERNPDVVLLTEVDQGWVDQLATLDQDYPYSVKHPLDNTYGMALYSQFELVEPEVRFLLEDDIPSIHTKIRLPSGELLKFYGLHPRPPAPQESDSTAQRDAELILVAKEIGKLDYPTVVLGDLNDVAWSDTTKTFREASRMLDPRIGRGLFNTFHAQIPFLRFALDHTFQSEHFRLASIERLGPIGSDHFPIILNLSLEESADEIHTTPTPEPSTGEKVEQTIEEGKEKEKSDSADG